MDSGDDRIQWVRKLYAILRTNANDQADTLVRQSRWSTLMGHLTTHVLDTARGQPGAGIKVTLYRHVGERVELVREAVTNADGRCDSSLLDGAGFTAGRYRLVFAMGIYFAKAGFAVADPPFVDDVILDFGIADVQAHYHVPLLASPWSWSTYRGS